jgi:hypothetical protein
LKKVPFVLVGELAPAMASRGKGAIVNVAGPGRAAGFTGRDRRSDRLPGF